MAQSTWSVNGLWAPVGASHMALWSRSPAWPGRATVPWAGPCASASAGCEGRIQLVSIGDEHGWLCLLPVSTSPSLSAHEGQLGGAGGRVLPERGRCSRLGVPHLITWQPPGSLLGAVLNLGSTVAQRGLP